MNDRGVHSQIRTVELDDGSEGHLERDLRHGVSHVLGRGFQVYEGLGYYSFPKTHIFQDDTEWLRRLMC